MPCYDPGPSPNWNRDQHYAEFVHDSNLADGLCKTMQILEKEGFELSKLPKPIQNWWRDHQERDRIRVQNEIQAEQTHAERQRALKKLTAYERKLLGLK